MALKFLSDVHATGGTQDSSGDLGSNGQVLSSTGSDTNWVNPTVGTTVIYKDSFTATNGQTAFTLANTVDSEDKTQVYIDGAYQSKGGYTVSGTTLTFDTGLETSSEVEVMTFSTATANNAASAVKLDTFTGDGSDLTFVLSEAVVDEKVTQVYINGVYQNKSTYSIAADLITLTFGSGNAPPNSSAIEVISFKTITSTDGTLTATTFLGDLNGTINTATTATTQSAGNNSTKISTTAYTDAKVAEAITNGTTGIAPSQNVVFDALALKSNLAGPTFTGTPAAPTASAGTNTTQLATTAFVTTGIANIVDSAPGALNTLNELAAALGDDVNFSTTVTDSIATKLPLAGGTLTGDVTFTGASYNAVWDTSANLLQFADNAVIRIGTGNDVDIYHSSNVTYIKTQTDLPIKFIDAGGADMLKITPNGSVDLYHNGTLALSTASGGASTFSGNISLADTKYIQLNNTSTDWRLRADNAGRFVIQTSGGSEFFKISSGGDATFGGNITVGDSHFIGDDGFDNLLLQSSSGENLNVSSANDVIFYTGGTSPSSLGTQRLRIFNSSGNATFSGNVTSSGLTVNTGNGAGKKIYLNGNTSRRNWLISSQENVDDAFEITRSTANGGSTYNSPSFLIQGSTGNVGIGTTSPVTKLNISNPSASTGSAAAGRLADSSLHFDDTTHVGRYSQITFGYPTSNTHASAYIGYVSTSSSASGKGDLVFGTKDNTGYNTQPTERMRISSGGNVEQGTVGTTASAYYYFNATTTADTGIIFKDNSTTNSGFLTYNHSSDSMKFGTNTSLALTISSGGDVGIGTSTPFGTTTNRTCLSVNGTSDVSINMGVGNAQKAYFYTSATEALLGTVTAIPLKFVVGGSTKLTISSGGTVGIAHVAEATVRFIVGGMGTSSSTYNSIFRDSNGSNILYLNDAKAAYFYGTLGVAGTKNFLIKHPIESKRETHSLAHSSIESPQVNNLYRGKIDLVNGISIVNLDTVSSMTDGTFILLNDNVQCFTTNESNWDAVKGSVEGNILTITSQNSSSSASISWMVIGERKDDSIIDATTTDSNGKLIVEPPSIEQP